MATLVSGAVRAESFWQRMALGLTLFILFGFFQFSARGFVDFGQIPIWVHFHALAMLSWLVLLIVQPTLVGRNNLALHRRLGRIGAALAVVIVTLGIFTGIQALVLHRQPPFFTPPFFLMLNSLGSLSFGLMVAAAIGNRRRTDWHRRLMIGATILILEPALGRLLPMPLLGGWGEWVAMLCQLGAVAIVARFDVRTLGRLHPATTWVAGAVAATHILIALLAKTAPVIALATSIAAQ